MDDRFSTEEICLVLELRYGGGAWYFNHGMQSGFAADGPHMRPDSAELYSLARSRGENIGAIAAMLEGVIVEELFRNVRRVVSYLEGREDFVAVMARNACIFRSIFKYIESMKTIKEVFKLASAKSLFEIMTLYWFDMVDDRLHAAGTGWYEPRGWSDFGSIVKEGGRLADVMSQFQTLDPPNYECLKKVVTPDLIVRFLVPIAATLDFRRLIHWRGRPGGIIGDFYFEYFRLKRPSPVDIEWLADCAARPDVTFSWSLIAAANEFFDIDIPEWRKREFTRPLIVSRVVAEPRAMAYLVSKSLANPLVQRNGGDSAERAWPRCDIGRILVEIVHHQTMLRRFLDGLDDYLVFPFPLEVILPYGNNLLHYATTNDGVKIVERAIDHLARRITPQTHGITKTGAYLKR